MFNCSVAGELISGRVAPSPERSTSGRYEGSGTTNRRWAHQDERNSLIAVSDASGAMVAINKYDEFGRPQVGNLGVFQYTGQMWLPETGTYLYKNRNYAPHLGRFVQADPIGYSDGMNLYAYVGNDPVNFTDPLGLQVEGIEFGGSLLQSRVLIGGSSYRGSIFYGHYVCVERCYSLPNISGDGPADATVTAQRLPPVYDFVSAAFLRGFWGGSGGWSGSPLGGVGEVGGGPGQTAMPPPERDCISSTDGPVVVKGGTFSMAMILGGSLSVGTFDIPSTGASGWFSSGSANLGWEGFAGGFYGVYGSFGDFSGRYGGFTGNVRGPLGLSITSDRSGRMTGMAATFGAGGGASVAYGGTRITSSNQRVC